MGRKMRKTMLIAVLATLLVGISFSPSTTPKAEAVWPWSNEAAILFDAGYHNNHDAYVYYVEVSYQDGSNGHMQYLPHWTYNEVLVSGGTRTWELRRGIRIKFDLNGYGRRECNIQTNQEFFFYTYAVVTYHGGGYCTIAQG